MTHTQEAAPGGRRDTRIVDEDHIAGAHGEDEIEAIDDGGRLPRMDRGGRPSSAAAS